MSSLAALKGSTEVAAIAENLFITNGVQIHGAVSQAQQVLFQRAQAEVARNTSAPLVL